MRDILIFFSSPRSLIGFVQNGGPKLVAGFLYMKFKAIRTTFSSVLRMARIFAISDIHVDIPENRKWLERWSEGEYRNDVLILAGDVTDNTSLLQTVLKSLTRKFLMVCFVPGAVICYICYLYSFPIHMWHRYS